MKLAGTLGGEIQRPFFSWENYRLLLNVVFWLMLTITYLGYMITFVGNYEELASRYDMHVFGLLPGTLAFAALTASWYLLPWDLGAVRPLRLLVVPVFLASVFWTNYSMIVIDRSFYWPFFLLVFAHGMFLFGPKRGIGYVCLVLVLLLAYLQLTEGTSLLENALLLVMISPSVVFFVVACAAVLEATRRREQAQELLEDLESAHAELRDYAVAVRQLTVSEERTRMAREIHDSVGHYLAVVNVQLEAAGKLLDEKPEAAREQIERAKVSTSGALSEVRRSVRALKPLDMTERSGAGALAALARGFEGAGPEVRFEVWGGERELLPEVELVLYRALQEGLTNALKHGGARHVSASLAFEPRRVSLAVSDDGVGAPARFMEGGFGLQGLTERAETLDGRVKAGNVPGGGFALEVELPVGEMEST